MEGNILKSTETLEKEMDALQKKLAQASDNLAQAKKQYLRAVAKLEKQKQAIEQAKLDIVGTQKNIANRVVQLQQLQAALVKRTLESEVNKDAV